MSTCTEVNIGVMVDGGKHEATRLVPPLSGPKSLFLFLTPDDRNAHIFVTMLFSFLVPGGIGMYNGFLAGLPAGSPVLFPSVNRFRNGGCDTILVVVHVAGGRFLCRM
jgi:hypothetical protein